MIHFRWPVIVITCLVVLALFFSANHYRQRFMEEEPLIKALERMDGIEKAVIAREGGEVLLLITPDPLYRGALRELIRAIREKALQDYRKTIRIEVEDHRNERLEVFASQVSSDLYEASRLHNYRSVRDTVGEAAEKYRLEGFLFAVDQERIYLQVRDGDYYLYEMILLEPAEGGD